MKNEEFFEAYFDLIEQTEGYVSHLSALYFLGQMRLPPEEATLMTAVRRPERFIGETRIRFIHTRHISKKETLIVQIGKRSVKISTLEQTILDLVDYRLKNLGYLEISGLFLTLPYDVKSLINLAVKEGDTALKRVLFYLIWTARGGWKDFPGFIKRTPVKLFPDLRDGDSYWCSCLHLRFPKDVLSSFPEGVIPQQLSSELKRRISLAAYAPFRSYFAKKNLIPVFEMPVFEEDFEQFCRNFIEKKDDKLVDHLLKNLAKEDNDIPTLILDWLESQAEKQNLPKWFMKFAEKRIVELLRTGKFERIVSAINIAVQLKLNKVIFPFFKIVENVLAKERRFDLIEKLFSEVWQKERNLKLQDAFSYLCALVMAEKNDEALEVISVIRKRKDAGTKKVKADLAYYAALIYNYQKNFSQARNEINICRPYYQSKSIHHALAGVEIINGSLHMVEGEFRKARRSFLTAYQLDKENSEPNLIEIETLGNLSLLEFTIGHFNRSIEFGTKAMRNVASQKGSIREFSFLRVLIPAQVYIGNLPKAILLAERLAEVAKKMDSPQLIKTAALFHSWLYELMGQPAIAEKFWCDWDEDVVYQSYPQHLFYPFIQVKITRLIMNGFLDDAHTLMVKEQKRAAENSRIDPSKISVVQRCLLKGLILAEKNPELALIDFMEARKITDKMDNFYDSKRLTIILGSFYPAMIADSIVVHNLKSLLLENSFDPFWFLYAKALLKRNIPEGHEYVHQQSLLTPELLMARLIRNYPFLKRLVARNDCLWKNRERLLIGADKQSLIGFENFGKRIHKNSVFVFDSKDGSWSYQQKHGKLTVFSNTCKILTCLIFEKANELPFSSLYQSVWGWEYETEVDRPALLVALKRAKVALSKISPAIKLSWYENDDKQEIARLEIKIDWEVIF